MDEGEIDTADVMLPAELVRLIPLLAKNTHRVWQRLRAADGWRYGPQRDDDARRHPGMVTFDELPESEQVYDVAVVTEVLKALIALGYRVERR